MTNLQVDTRRIIKDKQQILETAGRAIRSHKEAKKALKGKVAAENAQIKGTYAIEVQEADHEITALKSQVDTGCRLQEGMEKINKEIEACERKISQNDADISRELAVHAQRIDREKGETYNNVNDLLAAVDSIGSDEN